MKVAPKALLVPLSLWERAGVRETVMTPCGFHVGGVTPGVMTVGVGGLNGYDYAMHGKRKGGCCGLAADTA